MFEKLKREMISYGQLEQLKKLLKLQNLFKVMQNLWKLMQSHYSGKWFRYRYVFQKVGYNISTTILKQIPLFFADIIIRI